MDFGNGEVKYELISSEELTEQEAKDFASIGPGGTGMFEKDGRTYLMIVTESNKDVEILSVGKADDGVGKEVKYKVVEKGEEDQSNGLHLIRLEKVVSTPFGFNRIN